MKVPSMPPEALILRAGNPRGLYDVSFRNGRELSRDRENVVLSENECKPLQPGHDLVP